MTNMTCTHQRMANEMKTIAVMIAIYCEGHHTSARGELCTGCRQVRDYAEKRLTLCPFQQEKPTCGNCSIHCYKKDMRDTIKAVMRYAGPRMSYRHPVMALRHLLDSRRRVTPVKKQGKSSP